ncbi:hypothetical protein ATY30_27320 [Sinorhizobium americanum]|nr:hypothetical protein ATY30_27320 [Sinorhizobium americanum]
MGFEFNSAYSASKFGLDGWMEALQAEVDPFGIQTMIVNPGFFARNCSLKHPPIMRFRPSRTMPSAEASRLRSIKRRTASRAVIPPSSHVP